MALAALSLAARDREPACLKYDTAVAELLPLPPLCPGGPEPWETD